MEGRLRSPAFAARLQRRPAEGGDDAVQLEGFEVAGYLLGPAALRAEAEARAPWQRAPAIVFDDHNAEYRLQATAAAIDSRRPRRWPLGPVLARAVQAPAGAGGALRRRRRRLPRRLPGGRRRAGGDRTRPRRGGGGQRGRRRRRPAPGSRAAAPGAVHGQDGLPAQRGRRRVAGAGGPAPGAGPRPGRAPRPRRARSGARGAAPRRTGRRGHRRPDRRRPDRPAGERLGRGGAPAHGQRCASRPSRRWPPACPW